MSTEIKSSSSKPFAAMAPPAARPACEPNPPEPQIPPLAASPPKPRATGLAPPLAVRSLRKALTTLDRTLGDDPISKRTDLEVRLVIAKQIEEVLSDYGHGGYVRCHDLAVVFADQLNRLIAAHAPFGVRQLVARLLGSLDPSEGDVPGALCAWHRSAGSLLALLEPEEAAAWRRVLSVPTLLSGELALVAPQSPR